MELVSMNVRRKAAAKAASRITETDKTVQEKFGTASGSLFENARIHYTLRGSADAKTFLPNRAGRADRESAIQMEYRRFLELIVYAVPDLKESVLALGENSENAEIRETAKDYRD